VFRRPGRQSTICVSDRLAVELDRLQFDLGEGPRWESARTGRASISADLRGDAHPDWPVFGAAAAELGVGAVFSFPIRIGMNFLGVADLYRRVAGPLGDEATARALSISRHVAGPAAERATRSADSDAAEARDAPALRREVHQATGMILVQLNIGAAAAFALLQAHAFAQARTVEDVARDVVLRRLDFRDIPG
ncbi:MAG: GAF domain-containing protein, partial [Actinomycetota bacterium]|nr:GAF domain-containing protein [Actinomycetota bacterium]